jgi:hypothetical protein
MGYHGIGMGLKWIGMGYHGIGNGIGMGMHKLLSLFLSKQPEILRSMAAPDCVSLQMWLLWCANRLKYNSYNLPGTADPRLSEQQWLQQMENHVR